MLTGKTSVYIDTFKSDEEIPIPGQAPPAGEGGAGDRGATSGEEQGQKARGKAEMELLEDPDEGNGTPEDQEPKILDRSQFGKFIINFGK